MGMYLDGILTAPHIDSSGEILDTDGVDLTDFYEGKAVINWEHQNKSSEDIIGAFVYCKKIMKKDDCENARQKMYYEMAKGPYIYVIGELFDDEEHPGAVAAAAMVRYYAKRKEKMFIGWSIEGATLERDGNNLKRAVARRAAFTLRPCLKSAVLGLPEADDINKLLDKMDKSEKGLFTIDADALTLSENDFPIDNPLLELHKALEDLNKTLTAGQGNVAPSQLVGGAALSKEYIVGSVKNRVKAAVRDWNRVRPLRDTIKAALPEVSDQYIDHFTDLAEELALKKNMQSLIRIGKEHGHSNHDEDQKKLLEGLYVDPQKKLDTGTTIGGTGRQLLKLKNDAGQDVFIKTAAEKGTKNPVQVTEDQASNAENYHKVAKDFFGMGDHVPVTAHFSHPKVFNGAKVQAMEFKPGQTPYQSEDKWRKAVDTARIDGTAHKLLMMDHILGHTDRHFGNMIVGNDNKIYHIDNDSAFRYGDHMTHEPDAKVELEHDVPHQKAIDWIKEKNPKDLAKMLYNMNMSPEKVKESVRRLMVYQASLNPAEKIGKVWNNIQGITEAEHLND